MTEAELLQDHLKTAKELLVTTVLLNDMQKVTIVALKYLVAYHNGANLEDCAMPLSKMLPRMLLEFERIGNEVKNSTNTKAE